MPLRLQNIFTGFQNFGEWILHVFSRSTGLTPDSALIVLLVMVGYIILLLITIPLHRGLLRLVRKKEERLTRDIDNLRYLVAKIQQQSTQAIDTKGIRILFDMPSPDYLHHLPEIKHEIQNIETALGKTIIDPELRIKLEHNQKKRLSLKNFTSFYGRFLSVITLFIYRLFW